MSNKITWQPSTDPLIASYVLQSATIFAGPYSTVATITHDLTNPVVYDATLGVFYYQDAAGTLTTWYRLAAVDTLAQQGPWSAPFQPGTNLPPKVTPYTTDALLQAIKLRGMLPTAAGKTFTSSDFLSLATDEMRGVIVPDILSVRQDYFRAYVEFDPVLDSGTPSGNVLGPFQIPYRAIGQDPCLVQMVNSNQELQEIGRIQIEDRPYHGYGFWIQNNQIFVKTAGGQNFKAVRLWFYIRTNVLVGTDQVAYVQAFDAAARTVTLSAVPTSFLAQSTYDFIHVAPSFDTIGYDQPATLSGGVLAFSSTLPAGLVTGDQVSLSDQSAVVQLPVEFQPALAQGVVCRALEAVGDREGLAAATQKYAQLRSGAVKLIMNRAAGNPATILSIHAPIRRYF